MYQRTVSSENFTPISSMAIYPKLQHKECAIYSSAGRPSTQSHGPRQNRMVTGNANLESKEALDSATLRLRLEAGIFDELAQWEWSMDEGLVSALLEEARDLDDELESQGIHNSFISIQPSSPNEQDSVSCTTQPINRPMPVSTSPTLAPSPKPPPQASFETPPLAPPPMSQDSSPPATALGQSAHSSKPKSTSSSSDAASSSLKTDIGASEDDLYIRLRRLSSEVISLRLSLEPLRKQHSNLAMSRGDMEQSTLQILRLAIAESGLGQHSITLDRDLVFAILDQLSNRRDELWPILEQMRDLELKLRRAEYPLRQVEDQLHSLYHQAKQESTDLKETPAPYGNPSPSLETSLTPAPGLARDGNTEAATENMEDDSDEMQEYDPSKLHPKYAEWQKQYVAMLHLQEMLLYFARKEEKLRERKEQREGTEYQLSERASVILHLSKRDEEALVKLSNKVAALEAEFNEGLGVLWKLRQECIEAGIDESEVRDGLLSTGDDGEEQDDTEMASVAVTEESGLGNDDVDKPDFEEWIISPAGNNFDDRKWLRPAVHREDISSDAIAAEIKKLDEAALPSHSLATLSPDQLRHLEALRDEKNSTELDGRAKWTLAQVDNASMRVFLKRTPKPRSFSSEAANYFSSHAQQTRHPGSDTPAVLISSPGGDIYGTSSQSLANESAQPNGNSSEVWAMSVDADEPEQEAEPDYSLVNSWLFTALGSSIINVRLLGTILETHGVPLLKGTEQQVMALWEVDVNLPSVGVDRLKAGEDCLGGALRREGYDKALLQKLSNGDEDSGKAIRIFGSSSSGAKSGYKS